MPQKTEDMQHPTVTGRVATVESIVLPGPTAWPMALALGITLLVGGMLTHWIVSVLGLVLAILAATGWFLQVVPHEHHVAVPVHAVTLKIASVRRTRQDLSPDANDRKILPVETFTIASGIRGGLVGGAAMIIPPLSSA